jgi:Ca-activated chloride channel family protein
MSGRLLRMLSSVLSGAGSRETGEYLSGNTAPVTRRPSPGQPGFFRIVTAAILLSLALSTSAFAKSADDYFHGASSLYVAGKIQEASVEAEEGLRQNPGDIKLRMLAEQLRKMKDKQRGENDKNKGNDKNKQDPKNPDDSKDPDKNPKNSDKQDPDKKGDGKEDDKNKQPPKPGDEDGKDKDKKDGEGKQAPQPNRMSEEEAKRLLNSFADDEKKEQAERRKAVRQRAGTEQDW